MKFGASYVKTQQSNQTIKNHTLVPNILHVREIWSSALRQEFWLRVPENAANTGT
jgi:hypothetical protein